MTLMQLNNFSELNLPQLNSEAVAELDKDISIEEIIEAIKEFPNNKALGPDGYTIVLRKVFL